MILGPIRIVCLLTAMATSCVSAGEWPERAKLRAVDGAADDFFGGSVAIDGNTVVVGSINADGRFDQTGAAYVFVRRTSGQWMPQAKLFASDGEFASAFGESLAIDGDSVVVGAPFAFGNGTYSGAAYVFVRDAQGQWSEQAKLVDENGAASDWFGMSVSISDNDVAVGAPQRSNVGFYEGAVSVFVRDADAWAHQQNVYASEPQDFAMFGAAVALDGDRLAAGSPDESNGALRDGAVHIYDRDFGSNWSWTTRLNNPAPSDGDAFGSALALSDATVLVGEPLGDAGRSDAGAAHVYVHDGSTWNSQGTLTASDGATNDQFGFAIAIDGDLAIVGAYWDETNGTDEGAAYMYERQGSEWSETIKLVASDQSTGDWFGHAVGIHGGNAIVGAPADDDLGSASGSAYVFEGSSGLEIEITGDCPGIAILRITNASPGGLVAIPIAVRSGPFILPVGPCAGVQIDLQPPFLGGAPLLIRADANGEILLEGPVPSEACGRIVTQALDVVTCNVSNVAGL